MDFRAFEPNARASRLRRLIPTLQGMINPIGLIIE